MKFVHDFISSCLELRTIFCTFNKTHSLDFHSLISSHLCNASKRAGIQTVESSTRECMTGCFCCKTVSQNVGQLPNNNDISGGHLGCTNGEGPHDDQKPVSFLGSC